MTQVIALVSGHTLHLLAMLHVGIAVKTPQWAYLHKAGGMRMPPNNDIQIRSAESLVTWR